MSRVEDEEMVFDDIDRELLALPPEASGVDRVEVAFRAYERETGSSLSRPPTRAERSEVVRWLLDMNPAEARTVGYWRRPTLERRIHLRVTEKASALAWLACPSCGPAHHVFPVDAEPWSAQSAANRVTLRRQVSDGLRLAGGAWDVLDEPVCISVVAVVPRRLPLGRLKDVDNLVKGLLDAFEGIVFRNDSLVQCLAARRVEYAGDRGHYIVGVRAAEPFESDVIFDDPRPATIVWGQMRPPA